MGEEFGVELPVAQAAVDWEALVAVVNQQLQKSGEPQLAPPVFPDSELELADTEDTEVIFVDDAELLGDLQ